MIQLSLILFFFTTSLQAMQQFRREEEPSIYFDETSALESSSNEGFLVCRYSLEDQHEKPKQEPNKGNLSTLTKKERKRFFNRLSAQRARDRHRKKVAQGDPEAIKKEQRNKYLRTLSAAKSRVLKTIEKKNQILLQDFIDQIAQIDPKILEVLTKSP